MCSCSLTRTMKRAWKNLACLLSLLELFCRNSCLAGKCGATLCFLFSANRNVFILKFVIKMAFSYNNWGYFPFPPPVLICFSCPSLHFQRKMNNSVRGLAEWRCRMQWTCIKIHLKNLCIGLNISPGCGAIIASECRGNKHVLNSWRRSWKFPSFRVSQSIFLKRNPLEVKLCDT